MTIATSISTAPTTIGSTLRHLDGGDTTDNPPSVSITNPTDGATVSGTVSVTADASDDNGVSQVEFFVDGSSLGTDSDGSNGWSVSWDTTADADGGSTVEVVATDSAGQTALDSVLVTVDNSGGGATYPPVVMHSRSSSRASESAHERSLAFLCPI